MAQTVDSPEEQVRKKKLIKKIMIACGIGALVFFFGFVIWAARPNRNFYIPANYSGWVHIYYLDKNEAPILESDSGLVVRIPSNGILRTSSGWEYGWGKDRYFFTTPLDTVEIKNYEKPEKGGERMARIFKKSEEYADFSLYAATLRNGIDTVMFDGTKIRIPEENIDAEIFGKQIARRVDINSGDRTIEHFYVSPEPMDFFEGQKVRLDSTKNIWSNEFNPVRP